MFCYFKCMLSSTLLEFSAFVPLIQLFTIVLTLYYFHFQHNRPWPALKSFFNTPIVTESSLTYFLESQSYSLILILTLDLFSL